MTPFWASPCSSPKAEKMALVTSHDWVSTKLRTRGHQAWFLFIFAPYSLIEGSQAKCILSRPQKPNFCCSCVKGIKSNGIHTAAARFSLKQAKHFQRGPEWNSQPCQSRGFSNSTASLGTSLFPLHFILNQYILTQGQENGNYTISSGLMSRETILKVY